MYYHLEGQSLNRKIHKGRAAHNCWTCESDRNLEEMSGRVRRVEPAELCDYREGIVGNRKIP